jgi:hypothetical protein
MLQSGDVRLDLDDGPSAGQAARLLARSDATWGRQTYTAALAGLAASSRARAADEETDDEGRKRLLDRAGQAERLAQWLDGLLRSVPEVRDGAIPLNSVLDACIGFVRDVAARASELDGAAGVVLVEALDSLKALGDLERSPRAALGLVRHQVEMLTVGSDRARPGHLFVTMLRAAGYSGRSYTFVVSTSSVEQFSRRIQITLGGWPSRKLRSWKSAFSRFWSSSSLTPAESTRTCALDRRRRPDMPGCPHGSGPGSPGGSDPPSCPMRGIPEHPTR